MTQEDQVISVVAASLRSRGIAVLAEGGNQMAAFRFVMGANRRKAPDLAFVASRVLFIVEAKVSAADLFRPSRDGLSDADCMAAVISSAQIQGTLLAEGARRLRSCGRGQEIVTSVAPGLLAAEPFAERFPCPPGLELLWADVRRGSWRVERSLVGDVLRSLSS